MAITYSMHLLLHVVMVGMHVYLIISVEKFDDLEFHFDVCRNLASKKKEAQRPSPLKGQPYVLVSHPYAIVT